MKLFYQPIAMAESLLANSPVGILVYEGDTGNCVLANQAIADMLGESVAALRLQNFRALASWRRVGLEELAEAALHDGLSRHHEVTLDSAFGKIASLDCFISKFDFEGQPHLLIIVADITERKQAQEKLARERALLRCLIDSVSDLIFIKDRNSVYRGCNKASEAFIGMPECDQIGKTDFDFFDREKAEEIRKADNRVLEEGKPLRIEEWVTGRDGRRLLMDTLKAPYYDPDGKALGLVGVGRDITERRQAEEKLSIYRDHLEELVRERTAELEAANKEMHAFTYTVSHDLRAPLRHIDGFMELLQKTMGKALDEQSRHYMAAIAEAAKKMGMLIDDMLSFSRLGRHAILFQQVELGRLVPEVIRELEPEAAGRNIAWRIGDLPMVDGDASMLRMVLANLIANALKFTRPRQEAQIEIGSQPGQGSEAVIFVRDNGVGFDMAYGDKLFGVFQRLHRAEDFEGTGIGLANVRRIIDRHGGRTWAEGKPDHGAAFFFSLPQTPQGGGHVHH